MEARKTFFLTFCPAVTVQTHQDLVLDDGDGDGGSVGDDDGGGDGDGDDGDDDDDGRV